MIEMDTYQVVKFLHVPVMKAVPEHDNQRVHLLAAGGSTQMNPIVRRDDITAEKAELIDPRVMKDYQTYVGGVDVYVKLFFLTIVPASC
ncbi:hypothetical protein PHMEG_0005489 [Phytophthora megakarya]|uniref:Uncharacterized protein n=1 Tax=Phytophthora megakarya TaxID=4795 RepID=A0A225WRC5_9STRA|nr:hypothetical protein PHMEG_0005489 [Phytophthora megakarya]